MELASRAARVVPSAESVRRLSHYAAGALTAVVATGALAGTAEADPPSKIVDPESAPHAGEGGWGTMGGSGVVFTRPQAGDKFDRSTDGENGKYSQGLLIDAETGIQQCPFVEDTFVKGLKKRHREFNPPLQTVLVNEGRPVPVP